MSQMEQVDDIASFLLACLDRGDGAWEMRSEGLIEALLPNEIANYLSAEQLVTLALSPDVLAHEPGAELATPGSPVMDAFIRFASTVGRTAVGVILPTHFRGKGLREEVSRQVTYRNCRLRSDTEPPKVRNSFYAVHFFRVEYISDERREQVVVSAIDLTSMRPNQEFAARLPRLPIESESPPPAEWYSRERLDHALASARADLTTHVQRHSDALLGNARRRFEVESQRLSEYYGQVASELNRRAQKEPDGAKRAGILDKIAIAQADCERKITELGEKYRIRPRATLTSVLLIRQPKTFFDLFVDRGAMTRRVTFVYDSLLERLELPCCDGCGIEMNNVTVSPKGAHLCPACVH